MTPLVDCHAHLGCEDFDADRAAVRVRAAEAGVAAVLVVGEDAPDNGRVDAAVRADDGGCALLPCFGLHPDRYADERSLPSEEELGAVLLAIRENADRLAAIGEVGLDRWVTKDEARREAQAECLRRFAALSEELGLPLNVHSRSAGHHTLDLLIEAGATRVLMHAFDGKARYALRGAEAGFLFSIPPSIVRSPQKVKLVKAMPLESLALESDSPVLGPEKRVRNEPANLVRALEAIAEIKSVPAEQVAEVTTANARRLFPALESVLQR